MMSRFLSIAGSALLALFLAQPSSAQLTTKCQPLNETCPADPALGTEHNFYFNSTPPAGTWSTTMGTIDYNPTTGAAFTITKHGDGPTIKSDFYYFGGICSVIMKTSPGTGIISAIVLSSDDLDEVDWEFFGSETNNVSTNYFGKGNRINTNADYYPINGNAQTEWHNYTTVWTNTSLEWFIDGAKVRTLLPKDANDTQLYPQTPMQVSIGSWAGGDADEPQGTRDWAGGLTDYSKGPFTMYVQSAYVADFSTGKEYQYSDRSGSWESIKIIAGNSTAVDAINAKPETTESLGQKWNNLSSGTKTGIYCGIGGVGAIALSALAWFIIKQRKLGRQEAALAEARAEQERLEMNNYKKAGIDPDGLASDGVEYNAASMKGPAVTTTAYSDAADWRANSMTATGGGVMAAQTAWDATSAAPPPMSPHGQNFHRGDGYGPVPSDGPGSPARSFSTPNPNMRMGSPAAAQGYGNVNRMNSPAPMPPNRSFSSPRPYDGAGGYR